MQVRFHGFNESLRFQHPGFLTPGENLRSEFIHVTGGEGNNHRTIV
ncbi:MAG: hypothetical protein K0S58_569 [Nitrospira sp.]|jgi:hypothetical protein|nr:hypothetical protein [Nitrospira sp.]